MATIIKHPELEDYFVELTLDEIRRRPHGITDLYEANKLIVLKDFRLPIDLTLFQRISGNLSKVQDPKVRRKVKKLTATTFFKGAGPAFAGSEAGRSSQPFETDDAVRRAVYDVLCNGEPELFAAASAAIKTGHDVAAELFATCFPSYQYYRVVPSLRLTTTLFENLHWDNHQIADDFHQVRIFGNLDQRPRIWHTSHNFIRYAEAAYREHDLGRFAGRDPNELIDFINSAVLGGTQGACTDRLPRHAIAFEPGELWFGESRMISHQIFYGERAMVYMYFVSPQGMLDPERRFNRRVEELHARMAARAPA